MFGGRKEKQETGEQQRFPQLQGEVGHSQNRPPPGLCPELIRACDLGARGWDTHLQPSAVAEQTPLQQGLALPEQRVPAASSPLAPRGVRGAGGGGVCVQ